MKVCFVGSGSIGKRHIRNFIQVCSENNIEYELHLLRATDKELPREIQSVIAKVFMDPAKMDYQYDAIFIANPTYLHYNTIIEMKTKAKHIFVEKPLFDTLEHEVEEMNLPNENVYYVACPLRYTKVIKYAKEFLETHIPFAVRAISSSYLPDWRPGMDYRNTYSAHKSQGGGVCIDLIHEWDYISHLFGFPDNVYKFCGKYSDLEIDSEDLAIYIAKYKNFLVELHLDYFGRRTERKLELFCNDGRYIFDIANSIVFKEDVCIKRFEETLNDKYLEEMRFFFSVIKGNESTNDLHHAYTVQKITS